jgi:hypothetical protein
MTQISVTDYGAEGDGLADDTQAFIDAIDAVGPNGGMIFVPEGQYKITERLVLKRGIHLYGERRGRNPGRVGSTVYGYPDYFLGSTLYFADGTAGLLLEAHTPETDIATVTGLIQACSNGNTASCETAFQQPGASWSVIEDLNILSDDTGGSSTHGIECRTQATLRNLYISKFGGDGVRISATAGGSHGDSVYGNSNHSILRDVHCVDNGGNGFYIVGRDANAMELTTCDASSNGLWGFYDNSLLGNCYVNCHADANGSGSFANVNQVSASVYIGCYVEQSGTYLTSLALSSIVIGGQMASISNHPATTGALILSGRESAGRPIRHTNREASPTVSFTMGESGANKIAFTWGSSDDVPAGNAYKMRYGGSTGTENWWGVEYGGSQSLMQLPVAAAVPRAYAPAFRNGIFLGIADNGPRISQGTAVPTSGNWNQGDWVLNRGVSAGGSPGWVCTAKGTAGTLSGVTGSLALNGAQLAVNTLSGISPATYVTIAGVSGTKKVLATSSLSGVTGSVANGSNQLTVNTAAALEIGFGIEIAGVTGLKRITAIAGNVATLDSPADAAVSNAAVSGRNVTLDSASSAAVSNAAVAYAAPVFKAMAAIAA